MQRNLLILSWKCLLYVLIRIASTGRFKWVKSTYRYNIEDRKVVPKVSPFAFWIGAVVNPQWLELPMSRTNFHDFKDIRAIRVF